MTLDDFLKECEEKGAIPLSYRNHAETLKGTKTVEYENPKYKAAKAKLAKILGMNQGEDNAVSKLYGEEVVIRTKYGYHHGTLQGFNGKAFMLSEYLFSRKPLDMMGYSSEIIRGDDTAVPAEGAISISKIPLYAEKGY